MVSKLCCGFRNLLLSPSTTLKTVVGDVSIGSIASSGHFWTNMNVIRNISTTPFLLAEPLKKKKRLDPAVIKAREDRKKRKLEKQIRRLAKHERQLKPLEELDVPAPIIDNYKERVRPPVVKPAEVEEYRWLLEKRWAKHKFRAHAREIRMIDRILCSQEKALNELRLESEELYIAAIQMDFGYVPYEIKGPVETPPIEGYDPTEGDFIDISRKWE